MAKNTGKVREKSGNFVSPEKWEPCPVHLDTHSYYLFQGSNSNKQWPQRVFYLYTYLHLTGKSVTLFVP